MLLSLLPCPNLLQLVEVFTFAQQPTQWLHVLLTEATAREPAGRGAASPGVWVGR